jgi:hypothetical protein
MLGVIFLFAACAKNNDDHDTIIQEEDSGTSSKDGSTREGGTRDGGSSGDSGGACALGTTDHCGKCDHACNAGDTTTTYSCSDNTSQGTCTLTCLKEFYDLNGKEEDGCEAEDPIVQDTAGSAVAVTLPDTNDPLLKTNPQNIVGLAYGDSRLHQTQPTSRPYGRADWYHVTAEGAGTPNHMTACLGITNFPNDDTFEICLSDSGADGGAQTFPASSCKQVHGGTTSECVGLATDAGVYYVRVKKLSGSNTVNGYALYLEH